MENEQKILRDREHEQHLLASFLQDRRQQQLTLMSNNHEWMQTWDQKGMEDWRQNKERTMTRLQKEKDLDKFLTTRFLNEVNARNEDARVDFEGGVDEFTQNML